MNKMGLEKNHIKTYFPKSNFPNLSLFLPDIKINFAITQSKGPFTWSMSSKVLKNFMDFENLALVLE